MKITVAINNYNYSNFIVECVESVLNQTYQDIELIIIDDGSTDNSVELLENKYSNAENLKIVKKRNGGQLSTFNEVSKYVTGEIIFFLDADDLYKTNYIEKIVKIYKNNTEVDFVFSAVEKFYTDGKKEIVQKYSEDKLVGFSLISTLYAKEWVGSVTSSVSMKTDLFKKIVPIPFESEWITRADDCLIWGSSIFGANKYYFSEPLVEYRVHNSNNYHGKTFSDRYLYKREISINKLFKYFLEKSGMEKNIIELMPFEYRCRAVKDMDLFIMYFKIILKSELTLISKIKSILQIVKNTIKGQ